MALESFSFVLGHGSSCIIRPVARLSIACPRSSISVYCKSRQRNQSPQQRRQQIKRVSSDRLPLKVKPLLDGKENDEVEEITPGGALNSHQIPLSSENSASGLGSKEDVPVHLLEDTNILRADAGAYEEPKSACPDDIVSMVKNAEQNIFLLNHARVHALQELDKIILEKEALQAEINTLEMKLAETDARIKAAAQEKINVELLEDQIVKLKNDLSATNATEGAKDGSYSSNNSDSSLLLEFDTLKKENESLKDDIETIKVKLIDVSKSEQRLLMLESECSDFGASVKVLDSKLNVVQDNGTKLDTLEHEYKALSDKVGNLHFMLEDLNRQKDQAVLGLQHNYELQKKVEKLEESLGETKTFKFLSEKFQHHNEFLQEKIKALEDRLDSSDQDIESYLQLFQDSVEEFNDTLSKLKEESEIRSPVQTVDDMPWEFWTRLLLMVDGWLLEKKISSNDSKLLREMIWKRDARIRDAYLACKGKNEREKMSIFLGCTSSPNSTGLHIIQIAAEMAPVAKVGGLGDVVSGLGKALQRKGHMIEIILPKYDCMHYDRISDLKLLDVVVQSYFEGQLFKNKIWVGIIEGLPVYFIEPDHPAKFFCRGKFYGDHDDFKRFSYFSRAALELLYQAGKRPDIIHCHDWQTAFVAPLYWDIFAPKGLDSASICFTCHNFEYQGTAPASELASCGLDVHRMNRLDRMQDNSSHDRVNPVKGAIVFSNIITTVSPTYAEEVRTQEGGRGLHEMLKFHSRKFVGILNGIDTDAWNPSTDSFLSAQYSADDLQGKADNKLALRKLLNLSVADSSKPLVGCITRLVPQKGVHLIRHAIYKTLELGGQFVLLGSSPVPHIQREFEGIANHFESHSHARILIKYDDALSHMIYGASDMFVIPSLFEPCGLTQMIAMRYGSVPIVRKTGGLNDSVFDIDDNAVQVQYRNGFTFLTPDEQALNSAMQRAFRHCLISPESWQQLIQKIMRIDFSWDPSASQYEEMYEKSLARARATAQN